MSKFGFAHTQYIVPKVEVVGPSLEKAQQKNVGQKERKCEAIETRKWPRNNIDCPINHYKKTAQELTCIYYISSRLSLFLQEFSDRSA